jgi:fatty acyl-CoA reductase
MYLYKIGNRNSIADIIPVDLIVNMTISAAWFTAVSNNSKVMVYNCTSGQINKFTWGMLEEYGADCLHKNPFENVVIYPNPRFTLHR